MDFVVLGLWDDIVFWASAGWWLWLFILAYFYYAWTRDHLAFSPLLTLVVAGLLIYYLVIQHPFFGGMGFLLYMLVYGGILYILPLAMPFLKKKPGT